LDTIEVTAHFDQDGHITPLSFVWNGQSYPIEGTGRRWKAKDGHHILVMVAGNRVFHIVFNCGSGIWKLIRSGEQPTQPFV
jgi:hypothetical protein